MLNCKAGQIAIITHSEGDNLGKIVQCLQLLPAGTEGRLGNGLRWRIERPLIDSVGKAIQSIADRHLRPLLSGLADVVENQAALLPLPIQSEPPPQLYKRYKPDIDRYPGDRAWES